MKKETDLDYVNKVKDYDREQKRQTTSHSSWSLSESNAPLTPIKQKQPSLYYRVLSTLKKSTGHTRTKSKHALDSFEACFEEGHEVTEKECTFTQIFSWYG